MPAEPFSVKDWRCAVLGTGTMGAQIALSLALGGHEVLLWGRRPDGFVEAQRRATDAAAMLVAEGLAQRSDADAAVARIRQATRLQDIAPAHFVIEAVAEDLELKRAILAEAEAATTDATLASTTSALSATALQSKLRRPEDFIVAHYAQPAHLVALVEVVAGEKTAPETTAMVCDLLDLTGKTPVECPDIPGFLWARIQHAVLREFSSLVGRGLVTPETCDKVLREGYAARLPAMGAFEHADLAGLDLMNGAAAKAVWADLSNVTDPADTPVGALFSEGHTGMSSGLGFYDWTVRDAAAFKAERDREIVRRVKISAGAEPQFPTREVRQ